MYENPRIANPLIAKATCNLKATAVFLQVLKHFAILKQSTANFNLQTAMIKNAFGLSGHHFTGSGTSSESAWSESSIASDRILPIPCVTGAIGRRQQQDGRERSQARWEVLRLQLRRRQFRSVHQLPGSFCPVRTLSRWLHHYPGNLRTGNGKQVHDPGLCRKKFWPFSHQVIQSSFIIQPESELFSSFSIFKLNKHYIGHDQFIDNSLW